MEVEEESPLLADLYDDYSMSVLNITNTLHFKTMDKMNEKYLFGCYHVVFVLDFATTMVKKILQMFQTSSAMNLLFFVFKVI